MKMQLRMGGCYTLCYICAQFVLRKRSLPGPYNGKNAKFSVYQRMSSKTFLLTLFFPFYPFFIISLLFFIPSCFFSSAIFFLLHQPAQNPMQTVTNITKTVPKSGKNNGIIWDKTVQRFYLSFYSVNFELTDKYTVKRHINIIINLSE